MPTNFPSSVDSFTTKTDGVSDVLAADTNNLQDAMVAVQNRIGTSSSGSVVNTGATQTITGVKTFSAAPVFSAGITFSGGASQSGAATFGVSQTWQNLTASRSLNTTYTNSTGGPLLVWVSMDYGDLMLYVGSNLVWFFGNGGSARAMMIVPAGQTYSATAAAGRTFDNWYELR